jgi:beta-glucosidase
VTGEEIVQLYISAPHQGYYGPRHELKGFTKLRLDPGQSREVSFMFDDHTFAYYSTEHHGWRTEGGERSIEVGASSRDIRLTAPLHVKGEQPEKQRDDVPSYVAGDVQHVSRQEFAALLGRPLPAEKWDKGAPLTIDDTIRQLSRQNWIGKACYGMIMIVRKFYFLVGQPIKANNVMFIVDMPFNKIERMSGGRIARHKVEAFVRLASRRKR